MAHQSYDASSAKAKELRKKAGAYIKGLRNAVGLTQREVAQKLNLDYYTFISQIESGYGRVPPNLYRPLAKALDVPASEFGREIVKYYDPFTYDVLFGDDNEAVHPYDMKDKQQKKKGRF